LYAGSGEGKRKRLIPIRDSNPTGRFPFITVLLIACNIAVFLYQVSLSEGGAKAFIGSFALIPVRVFRAAAAAPGPVSAGWTVLTSMFLHGGWLHLIGNMLYLWIFGNNVEDAMGRLRFLGFYVLCGAAAALCHALPNIRSEVPLIGASGAVSGVLGAYLLLFPRARVLTLFTLGFFVRLIEVPAMVVLGIWFLLQALNALGGSAAGGVAWYAHLGGFAAGMALIGLFKRSNVPWGGRRRYGPA
jgi:membrane associated rhomboid family serine protease